jgi:hypothetical protein
MSTAAPPQARPTPPPHALPKEIIIFSHSSLFYWWPVWASCLIMGGISLMSGELMAIVPTHTEVVKDTVIRLQKGENKIEEVKRTVLMIPDGKEKLLPKKDGEFLNPSLHISNSKNVGVLFAIILLLVIFITNVPLRGLWSVIVIGTIIFLSIIFAILGWWEHIFTALGFLDIRINAGGYFTIGLVLLFLWAIVTFLFDKQIYMVFATGQFRVRLEIGEGETAYDTTGMTIQKQRSDLFRHMILGFGSGDLIVRTAGAQVHTFDLPNVLSLGRRVKEIEELLRSKQVTAGP